MSPQLTADLDGVLNSLLGLYGNGQPAPGAAASVASSISADISKHVGAKTDAYSNARGMQVATAEAHAGRDSVVHQAVSAAGDGTVNGRGRVSNQIADLQTRMQAIASVGDTRFSGPALLDSAQSTLSNVTKQVNSDVAAAHQQAARIMPPRTPQRTRGRVTPVSRRKRKARSASVRSRSGRPRRPVPSDGTAGGKAVSAASAHLGAPYIWGGGGAGGPTGGGFDCSGLTQYAVAQATDGQVVLPRTTYDQIYSGERVHPSDVRPGDLVFPASSFSSRGPEHVQLAAGNGMVIEAPYSGSHVKWSSMPPDAVVVRVM